MLKLLFSATLIFGFLGTSCRGQNPDEALTPAMCQRVEALLRSHADFPAATTFTFKLRGPGELPGFEMLAAHYSSSFAGASGDLSLLISKDGTKLVQLATFDISESPRTKIPFAGRPARGGPETAPVVIVGFDDLECPFCARLHQTLFPALLDRYKDQVHVIYQSVPSEAHPWAMHAAIDADCLAKQSSPAYWAAVDNIHQHFQDFGKGDQKLTTANRELDAETMEEGKRFHLDAPQLQACVAKQDPTEQKASMALADKFGVVRTPTVFVNGAKFEGDVPIEFVFDMVDNALRAEGQVPPPRRSFTPPATSH